MNRKPKTKPPTARAHAQLQAAHDDVVDKNRMLAQALIDANNHLAIAEKNCDDTQKALASVQTSRDCYRKTIDELKVELDTAHTMLDAMPEPPARKLPATDQWSSERTIALPGRLAAWLAAWLAGRSTR